MTYFLYIKTHNITGLKYLGQTKSANPYEYIGSGKYWTNHLKFHGKDIRTEILLSTESKDELIETGLFFSKLWDIVKSKDWANLTEESGSGGNLWTQETHEKIKRTMLERYGTEHISQVPSVKEKISKSLKGVPKSEEHKRNMKRPKTSEEKQHLSLVRRKLYRYGNEIIKDNLKDYCEMNGLSYQMFLRNVKNSMPYKGKIVKVLQ
jgi:hypothetical protein